MGLYPGGATPVHDHSDANQGGALAANTVGTAQLVAGNVTLAKMAVGSGAFQAGTSLTVDPYAITTASTWAHGLPREPDFYKVVFECKTAEIGYSIGDRVEMTSATMDNSASSRGWAIQLNASGTNSTLMAVGVAPALPNKSTLALANITNANWKLIVTPYIVL